MCVNLPLDLVLASGLYFAVYQHTGAAEQAASHQVLLEPCEVAVPLNVMMYVALIRSATEQLHTALVNMKEQEPRPNGCRQVAKVAESDADYRKFYIENSSATVRLRAETKCASSLPAALLLQYTSSLFVFDCVILP